jgi:hypothetical protein
VIGVFGKIGSNVNETVKMEECKKGGGRGTEEEEEE